MLTGWKEIAEYLNLTPRTAQRWEQLGLPVRRVSNSSRSPIIALPAEIEGWVQRKTRRRNGPQSQNTNRINFQVTRRKTQELAKQLGAASREQRRLLEAISFQISKK